MGLELLIKGFFLSAISLAQLNWKSQNVHYRYFMDVIFAQSLGRSVICGFLSSTECEYSVSLCNENVNAYCTLWDKLEFFHLCILVFTMLIFSFKYMPLCEAMLWFFFGDFHVIGIELIGTTMSSFGNKKPVYRMLFVHSKLENMGKKSFWFCSASYMFYQWSQSQINRKHQHPHGTIWGR